MNRLVAIVGPTGAGKSRLALHLAQTFDGEIVGADSRQVYHHMDIGTTKPTPKELALVTHHLVGIINPDEDFSLAQYQQLAFKAINDIQQRNKLALLAGGSGLYVWSVLEGWGIPEVPPDPDFRHNLEETAASGDGDGLYQQLMKVDPVAAQRIDRRNVRRVIRALEVHRQAETPFSRLQQRKTPPFDVLIIGLTVNRAELYHRLDLRVDEMIKQGLIAEVEKLVGMGYHFNMPAMSGIGYRQIGRFLKGELSLEAAIQQIKSETHRFVRHQYNWFKLNDKRIHWFDMNSPLDTEIAGLVAEFMSSL